MTRHKPPSSTQGAASLGLAALALLALVAGCAGPTAVVDYFVDPVSGSDANPGTAGEPYQTLTHALTLAEAGHTIHLASGTYDTGTGEVWPTFVGLPPEAAPNVPSGVTITGDGNLVRLAGPIGFDTNAALVFAGDAALLGVVIAGFEVGAIVGPDGSVEFAGVTVSGSGEIGVIAGGDAELTIRGGAIVDNQAIGVMAVDQAVVTLIDAQVARNHPGVDASDEASLTITGGEYLDNGSGIPGGSNSAVSVYGSARLEIEDALVHGNAYAGVHMQGSPAVTIGPGTQLNENFIGLVADLFQGGSASLAFDGATVQANQAEGILWSIPLGDTLTMRDTAVIGNGGSALVILGDAQTIDFGTAANPGGNDFSDNAEPLIADARPDRAVPDGTVITLSQPDIFVGCPVPVGPLVGPEQILCDGVMVLEIAGVNNRVQVTQPE